MLKLLLATIGAMGALALSHPANAADCHSLASQPLADVRVTGVELTPAGPMLTPVQGSLPIMVTLPAFCRIKGVAGASVGFEVWLPVQGWNGRLLSVGNGGFGGEAPLSSLAEGLAKGYAVTGNDTGHQGASSAWMQDPAKVRLWGHSAVHLVTAPAKALVEAFYGRPARKAYFEGCSTGGAEAMEEAEYFPDDYDGVVAGAPGMSYAHLMMSFLWGLKATEAPGALLSPEKLKVLHAAVLAACDSDDGLKDGLISDPLACRFDLTSVICKPGADPSVQCLTPAEALTARRIYEGPRNSRTGAVVYPGFAFGSEADPMSDKPLTYGWTAIQGPLANIFAIPLMRTMVFHDPNWDWRRFDWDKDINIVDAKVGPDITALSSDLSAFEARGGKLVMFQGWGDQFNGQSLPIGYRQSVIDQLASKARRGAAERRVDDFMRVFMAPGMAHCVGGPGFTNFDALLAVQTWVEERKAPDLILASARTAEQGRRPLCAYPKVAHYAGMRSTTDPTSFQCVASRKSS